MANAKAQWVYFAHATFAGAIKIGTAGTVRSRIAELQTGQPEELILLGSIPGDRDTEKELHRQFADWRIRGEWFRADETLMEEVRFILASRCRLHSVQDELHRFESRRHLLRGITVYVKGRGSERYTVLGSNWYNHRDLRLDLCLEGLAPPPVGWHFTTLGGDPDDEKPGHLYDVHAELCMIASVLPVGALTPQVR